MLSSSWTKLRLLLTDDQLVAREVDRFAALRPPISHLTFHCQPTISAHYCHPVIPHRFQPSSSLAVRSLSQQQTSYEHR